MQAAVRRLTRAIEQVQIGDLDGALSTASAVVRHNPELVDGHFILGMLCRDKGRLKEALEHLWTTVTAKHAAKEEIALGEFEVFQVHKYLPDAPKRWQLTTMVQGSALTKKSKGGSSSAAAPPAPVARLMLPSSKKSKREEDRDTTRANLLK